MKETTFNTPLHQVAHDPSKDYVQNGMLLGASLREIQKQIKDSYGRHVEIILTDAIGVVTTHKGSTLKDLSALTVDCAGIMDKALKEDRIVIISLVGTHLEAN